MLDKRVESFSQINRKPALEKAEGPMIDPRSLWGVLKRVYIWAGERQ